MTDDRSILDIGDGLEAFVRVCAEVSADDPEFGRGVHLFDLGYLDSLGTLRLIDHIERSYHIKLGGPELNDPRFVSIDGISAVVREKCARD